jgi:NAD(P)-dependent dehydrogenase (short-subunit alcohol dehydrogenase family)
MTQSVLITGCSAGGIGDHLAREFHARGFRVFASARDLTKLEKLKQLGVNTLPLDVTSAESIQAAAQEIGNVTGGTLDILINNSGSG